MQKMIKKYRKAKGFTLVELLIVIIIIGILAGMMMLSSGSATDKAEATKIVSDLRNIKAAVIMFYADNNGWPKSGDYDLGVDTPTDAAASIDSYLDNKPAAGYKVTRNADGLSASYQGDKLGTDGSAGIKTKLKDMAKESGLYGSDLETNYNGTDSAVYIVITK